MELFKLMGKIAIDNKDANQTIEETTGKGEKAHSRLSGAFSKIGSAAKVCGKAVAAGMVAAGGAIIKIGKDAVASYADYEQLVGGVETLFKDSAKTVQNYAQNAYKTAGLSANEYMETVTSFSASLLQSLDGDTAKAAESANLAITDMADNANKMGTAMGDIQNAYQGFAKQNYTMLDNLKLGYGGTKEEMQRLLADAEKLSGIKYDISSFDDIVQAIHVVQTEMGITGTTAKEAATTIQGSVASMKGAWQNLLTGMADENQNLDLLFKQFVDSVVVVGDNLIPRIQALLPRIVTGISQLASSLSAQLPAIMESVLPSLITGAVNIVAALIRQLPALIKSIIKSITTTLKTYGSEIQKSGSDMLQKLITGITNNLPKIIEKAAQIVTKLVSGLANNLPKIIAAAGKIIGALIQGLVAALPSLIAKAPKIIASLAKGLISSIGSIVKVGFYIVQGLWKGIGNAKDWIIGKIKGFGKSVLDSLKSIFKIHSPSKETGEMGKNLALGLAEGIEKNKKYAKKKASEMGKIVLKEAEKTLSSYKTHHKMSLAEEMAYWKEIIKHTKKGSDARLSAERKYLAAKKSYEKEKAAAAKAAAEKEKAAQDKILSNAESFMEKMKRQRDLSAAEEATYWALIVNQTKAGSDARKSAEDKYYAALEQYQKDYENYVNNIMQQMSLFEEFVKGDDVSGDTLINNLQSQITGLEDYYSTLENLNTKIGGTKLYEYLSSLSTDNLSELQAINSMTDEQLAKYVEMYDTKYKLACDKATEALGTINITLTDKTSEATKVTADALKTMTGNTSKYTSDMLKTVEDKFTGIKNTISNKMSQSVAAVQSAVAQMRASLAEIEALQAQASAATVTVEGHAEGGIAYHASGGIMTKPTIFGYTPSTNTYHVGGEAGAEAIAPIDTLQQYVRAAVAAETGEQNSLLARMVDLLEGILDKDNSVYLNSKDISRAVNRDLGVIF